MVSLNNLQRFYGFTIKEKYFIIIIWKNRPTRQNSNGIGAEEGTLASIAKLRTNLTSKY
jgi:hypothetical protein